MSPEPLYDLIKLALLTGMRLSEMLNCKWKWIDFKESSILLPATHNKSKEHQRVILSLEASSLLKERKMRVGDSEFVFPSKKTNRPIHNPGKAWRKALTEAGLNGLRIHDLRHTFSTRIGELGYPVQVIQTLLRHSDVRTSMRYVHPGQSLRDAVEALSAYGPKSNEIIEK